jgi:glycine betaine catabolism A
MSNQYVTSLLGSRRPGFTLPQPFYTDPAIFDLDLDAIFYRKWLFVAFEVEVPTPGDYVTVSVGKSSIVLVRSRSGEVRGFFNTCRHRGAELVAEGSGHCPTFVCRYHQWSYSLDGKCIGARGMGREVKELSSLVPVAIETVGGTIYICLSDAPPDFKPFRDAFGPLVGRYNLKHAKVVHRQEVIEKANWKLAMENARECAHCRIGHPELAATYINSITLNFDNPTEPHVQGYVARLRERGIPHRPIEGGWFTCGHVPLSPGSESMTLSGERAVRRLLAEGVEDLGVMRWHLQPHCYNIAMPDYVFTFSIMPISVDRSLMSSKWLVHKDAEAGVDFDPEELHKLWSTTNLQDVSLTELNQRGVNSAGYRPGPYIPGEESWAEAFTDWYCREISEFVLPRTRLTHVG